MKLRLMIYTLLCSIAMSSATAQVFKRRKHRKNETRPNIILVQLPTYHDKAEAFKKKGNDDIAAQCIGGGKFVSEQMIKDFHTNFTYSEYYFYYDTDADKVLKKQFDGIFYDKEMKPVSSVPVKADDTTYQIMYFGRYIDDSYIKASNSRKNDPYDGDYTLSSTAQRLVVLNHNFKNMQRPAPNGSDVFYSAFSRRYYKKNVYSRTLDIYYVAQVKFMNGKMKQYYK